MCVHCVCVDFDPKLVEQIMRESLDSSSVNWNDIAGLVHAKQAVTEAVVWPMKQPELFKGPRAPPKGMLLFGPPGTGQHHMQHTHCSCELSPRWSADRCGVSV